MLSHLFWNSGEQRLRAFWRLLLQLLFLVIFTLFSTALAATAGMVLVMLRGEISLEEMATVAADSLWLQQHPVMSLLLSLGALVAFVISVWLAGALLDRRRFVEFGFRFNRAWWLDFGFGLGLGGLLMLLIFLVEWAAGWITISDTFQSGSPHYPFVFTISSALVVFVAVGLYEELFSRGYQLKNMAEGLRGLGPLDARGAVLLSMVLSSLVFGLAHAFNPNTTAVSIINLILAGFLLAAGYLLTRELAIPIGLHISWNFFQGNVFGFPVSGLNGDSATFIAIVQGGPPLFTGGAFGPEGGLLGTAAMLLGILLTGGWVQLRYGRAAIQEQLATRERE